jgi:hypothetical protein
MVDVSRIRMTGPIVPFAAGFAAELQALGYTECSARAQVWLAAHLSTWMAERDLAVSALDTGTIAEFVAWRRASGRTAFRSAKALEPLLCYLRRVGAAPQPAPPELPAGPVEVLLEGFRDYLRAERGVTGKAARDYAAAVRPLLDELADAERVRVEAATAAGVSGFILGQCRIREVRAAQLVVTATARGCCSGLPATEPANPLPAGLRRPGCAADRRVPRRPPTPARQQHPHPQRPSGRDPLPVSLRGPAPSRTRRRHRPRPGDPTPA